VPRFSVEERALWRPFKVYTLHPSGRADIIAASAEREPPHPPRPRQRVIAPCVLLLVYVPPLGWGKLEPRTTPQDTKNARSRPSINYKCNGHLEQAGAGAAAGAVPENRTPVPSAQVTQSFIPPLLHTDGQGASDQRACNSF
jgi:hypothetical protein